MGTLLNTPQIEQVTLSDLIPYARNSKLHSPEQVGQIAASIREFGFNNPVLIDKDNGIIAGHGRVLGAQKLGLESVPCLRLAHLTETQKRAYIIADNRLSETGGGWDTELLALEIEDLRKYFQYFATAALAAEVSGRAWSFGFPRPDDSGFNEKLAEIWGELKDGTLQRNKGAPQKPKDDQIDVFAARLHEDGLPGFLLAAGQVATGNNWRAKSLRGHVDNVFYGRWFGAAPVTQMIAYHIIPFTRPDDEFFDDCRVLGNILHRLRVPKRVAQAQP